MQTSGTWRVELRPCFLRSSWPLLALLILVSGGCTRRFVAPGQDGAAQGDGGTLQDGAAHVDGGGAPVCGNGIQEAGEVCDDGNNQDGDDCRSDCLQYLPLCGNASLDPGEGCDDGNQVPDDGCSETCQSESCDEVTCPAGCCDAAGVCQDGTADSICGISGAACADCTTGSQICRDQACVTPPPCTAAESEPCGNCGTRTCDASGQWGPCEGEGVCAVGASDAQACGDCGTKTRTCSSTCAWGSWSACSGEGVCSPSATDSASCGDCGTKTRTCSSTCSWGAYGSCTGEGVCSPGAHDTTTTGCTAGCFKQRTCTSSCAWGSWGPCIC